MPTPRRGRVRSLRRLASRARYAAYLASPGWYDRRRAWAQAWTDYHHSPPECVVCDKPWTLVDDLHHATYDRLGHEADRDLLPMDRSCHDRLHDILDASSAWRRMPRPVATIGIVAALRTLRTGSVPDPRPHLWLVGPAGPASNTEET
jgi:hypothetical protein